jgi:hypothetical protein
VRCAQGTKSGASVGGQLHCHLTSSYIYHSVVPSNAQTTKP